MQTEFTQALGSKIVLFFKSQIAAYTDKNGRFVAAHSDKRTKKINDATDDRTIDMFADAPAPVAKHDESPLEKLEAKLADLKAHEPRFGAAYRVKQKHYDDTRVLREQIAALKGGESKPAHVELSVSEQQEGHWKVTGSSRNVKVHAQIFQGTKIGDGLGPFFAVNAPGENGTESKEFKTKNEAEAWAKEAIIAQYERLDRMGKPMTKSSMSFDLFLKSHVKQFTRTDGTVVKEHDDKRQKKMQAAQVPRRTAQVEQSEGKVAATSDNRRNEAPEDAEDVRGAAHGYGTHNIEEGDTIQFKAGEFSGSGKIKSVGKDGATVEDAEGRDHNVHWHEVTGFKADRGDGGGKKPPEDGDKPTAEGEDDPKKEPQNPSVLGKQEPIPAESFNAADYAKSHDQADVSADSIIAQFPDDTKEKISAAQDRLKSVEETIAKFMTDGKWTVERQDLHRKILYDGVMGTDDDGKPVKIPGLLSPERVSAARPDKGEKPAFIILGGRGGSGKSSFKGEVYEPDRCIVLDADHIKSMLPEYEGWNAHQVHEESGELFDHVADFARIMGLNVVLDKTMKTAKSAIADVEKFKRSGYRTEAHYMHLPRQEAGKRAVKRFLDGGDSGRFVPPEIVLSNTTNEAAFDEVSKLVDAWSFRDNNVARGEKPILISQKGDPAMKKREILHKSMRKSIVVIWRQKK